MKFRHFFLNGPVSPANMPKGATKVCRYDRKVYASSIQQDTWGFAEYDRPIQPVEQEQQRQVAGKQKYRNCKVKANVDGNQLSFDSKKEEHRYFELLALLNAGIITDLRLQQQFTLLEGYIKPTGERVRRMHYTADFSYVKEGILIVEDVKSRPTRTTDYQMRKN